jgi:hypothetical protein
MENIMDLEEEGLVRTTYLQFNNSWKDIGNIETYLLFIDYRKSI